MKDNVLNFKHKLVDKFEMQKLADEKKESSDDDNLPESLVVLVANLIRRLKSLKIRTGNDKRQNGGRTGVQKDG